MQPQRVADKLVHDLIGQAAEKFGARLVHNVLLQVDDRLSHFDFILIDRFGPLIIDVELWPGHAVGGESSAPSWTATPPGGRTEWFANPLLANRARAHDLHQALVLNGNRLAPEYVTDIVLFHGSDLRGLRLSDIERSRVLDVQQLEEALRARYDFAPNAGGLQRLDVDSFAARLHALDRTASVAASYLSPAPRRDSAAGLTALWTSVGMASRTGKAVWTLAVLSVVILAMGAVGYIGIDRMIKAAAAGSDRPPLVMPAASTSAVPDRVTLAKRAYQAAAPREYAATIDLNTPQQMGNTFVWHYVPRTGERRGIEQAVSVTIDEKGRLVRLEGIGDSAPPPGITLVP